MGGLALAFTSSPANAQTASPAQKPSALPAKTVSPVKLPPKAERMTRAGYKLLPNGQAYAYPDGTPVVKGKAALLVDPRSGQVIWEKNARQRLPIASLTKVMTALLILESGKLEETVTASKTANETPYSSIYLAIGEKVKLRDLLWGIMLRSGNDACVAAAEHLYGSVPKFIERMNRRAKQLGMNDTHFVTVNGLHDPDHYSTAMDMATVTLEAMKYPLFNEMVGTQKHQIDRSIRKMNALFYNRSRILWKWDEADGVKTGYTKQAGHCFIGSATVDGWRLLSVILKSPQVGDDTRNLLEYGFREYQSVLLAKAGDPIVYHEVQGGRTGKVPLGPMADVYTVVKKGHADTFQAGLVSEPKVVAPFDKGFKVAGAYWGDRVNPAAVADLVTLESVEEAPVRVAARAVTTAWWPMAIVFVTFGALRYGRSGTPAKNYRKRRNRVPKRSRNVGRGRTRLR
ncbi:MAG: D-alanyl-D-alanine carboxypeptidase [Armatimonadetes bacterium]|nr:D-alanyl-D-alanine carboxypeptidase [Armatimonadota bacterium]